MNSVNGGADVITVGGLPCAVHVAVCDFCKHVVEVHLKLSAVCPTDSQSFLTATELSSSSLLMAVNWVVNALKIINKQC